MKLQQVNMQISDIVGRNDSQHVKLTRHNSLLDMTFDGLQMRQIPNFNQQQRYNASTIDTKREETPSFKIVWRNLSYIVRENTLDVNKVAVDLKKRVAGLMQCDVFRKKLDIDDSDGQICKSQDPLRIILTNVNGYIESGKITALMGPSGAGKTSLLNALTVHRDGLSGRLEVIDSDTKNHARLRVSFIPQKDHLIDTLTVRENLMFACQIKNSRLVGMDHESNVAKVVDSLRLDLCLDSLAGNLSGGEYKRLSIGQELLSRPDLLVLDEPTTGLDSLSCKRLIVTLKELLMKSRIENKTKPLAIVLTIHQPSIDVFQMFDRIYFMAHQGNIIYDGEPEMALSRVKKISGIVDSPTDLSICNPGSYLMDIASGEYGQEPIERLARYQQTCFQEQLRLGTITNRTMDETSILSGSHPFNSLRNPADSKAKVPEKFNYNGHLYRDSRLKASMDHSGQFLNHLKLLTRRILLSTWREPMVTRTSTFFYLFLPLVMYTVNTTSTDDVNICPIVIRDIDILTLISNETARHISEYTDKYRLASDNVSMLYMTMLSLSVCSMAISSMIYPSTMHITLKEYRNGWYSTTTYSIARALANLPFESIMPTLSMILTYYLLNQARSYMEWRMLAVVAILVLINMVSSAHGLINGVIFMDSVEASIFLSIANISLLSMVSGFMARFSEMPRWLQIIGSVTHFRQAFLALLSVRFGYNKCPCDESLNRYINTTEPGMIIPKQLKSIMEYYGSDPKEFQFDQLDKSIKTFSRSFSNGIEITSCDQMKSIFLQSYKLNGDELIGALAKLICILLIFHLILSLLIKRAIHKRM